MDKKSTVISVAIIGFMFFIFGFVSWVNAILIPYFKISLELTNFKAYLVAFAFYIAYFVMSVPSSYLLEKLGFKKGMMLGFFVMATGAFLFVPAALTRMYWIFLFGLFSIGTGLAILQSAANPYITIVGPIDRAAQRMSIMGLCNKFAGIIAPLIFAAVILKVTDNELFLALKNGTFSDLDRNVALVSLVRRVIGPYSILGTLLVLAGLMVYYSPLPEINTSQANKEESDVVHEGKTNILQFPNLVFGALAIFFHVGSQIIAIDTIIGYAQSMGLTLLEAKTFPSYTLGATMIGYVIGIIAIPRFISQKKALITVTVLGAVLSVAVLMTHGEVLFFGHRVDISIWFLVALGLPNSLIYANIWPLAIKGLGRFTKIGSALLIMAIAGGALLPLVYGRMVDMFNPQTAYWILIPCYMIIFYFAFAGHKMRSWK